MGLPARGCDAAGLDRQCAEYYRRFTTRFGTSKCTDITGVKFKENYDIGRFFLKGLKCLGVIYTSIDSLFDIILEADPGVFSKTAYPARPCFEENRLHCAGSVLAAIENELNLDLSSVITASRGFSGGIASQGDICGALLGGVLALGAVYGPDLKRIHSARAFRVGLLALKEGSRIFRRENLHPSFKTSSRVSHLYRSFVARFGSADCTGILGETHRPGDRDLYAEITRSASRLTLDVME